MLINNYNLSEENSLSKLGCKKENTFDGKYGVSDVVNNPVSFERAIDYLRISVTDRCNLRCIYCIPEEGIVNKQKEEILTFEEILKLANIFASLGIKKIRLTGGEPLVRKGIISLVRSLNEVKGIGEVSLTTNGVLLLSHLESLKDAGLKGINISLDTLNKDKFKKITGGSPLIEVLEGIRHAEKLGFYPLKLNMVVMKGINDDEIIDFLEFAISNNLNLRFIEFMKVTPLWREDYFIPVEEVREICRSKFSLKKVQIQGPSPAEYYKIGESRIGFIKTDKDNCRKCNRLRLTSTGELKVCLYENEGLFLRNFLREGFSEAKIKNIIEAKMRIKKSVNYANWATPKDYMCSVGG